MKRFILIVLLTGAMYAALGAGTGRIYSKGTGTTTTPPPESGDTYYMDREDTGDMLREDGTKLLRETAP